MIEQKNSGGEKYRLVKDRYDLKPVNYGDMVYGVKITKATCPQYDGDMGTVNEGSNAIAVGNLNLVWVLIYADYEE